MRRVSVAIVAAVALLTMVVAIPAIAATLTSQNIQPPCSLEARSYQNTGDWATSPSGAVPAAAVVLDEGVIENGTSPEGSQDNPFDVAWDGRVDFRFQTGNTVFLNNEWAIYVTGLPVPILSGRDDNPGDLDEIGFVEIENTAAGAPRFVGTIHVSGSLVGNSGASRCDGEGWVRLVGDPVGTVPWLVMAAFILTGMVFLVATPYTLTWEEGQLTPWEQHAPGSRPEN